MLIVRGCGKWLLSTELAYCYFDTLFTLILGFSKLLSNIGLRCKDCKLCKLLTVTLIPCLL